MFINYSFTAGVSGDGMVNTTYYSFKELQNQCRIFCCQNVCLNYAL